MVDYSGPDKLIGTLLGTIGPTLLYWEDVKSLDVQRVVNSLILEIESETQEYGGFGNASFKDANVQTTLFMLQENPLGITDNVTEEQFIQLIHNILNQYDNSSQGDTVCGNPLVWVKIIDEVKDDFKRGIILYQFTIQVRVYVQTPLGTTTGPTTTSLTQMVLNFLSGMPAGSTAWTALAASTVKSLDLQRTGNVITVHAPTINGRVIGIGEGQVGGLYTQQQLSQYTYKLTLYGALETDVVTATDWVAANSVTYFLNVQFGQGAAILAKLVRYGEITKERGIWWRDLDLMVEAIVGF